MVCVFVHVQVELSGRVGHCTAKLVCVGPLPTALEHLNPGAHAKVLGLCLATKAQAVLPDTLMNQEPCEKYQGKNAQAVLQWGKNNAPAIRKPHIACAKQ